MMHKGVFALFILALLLPGTLRAAESATPIKIGLSAAFSGPTKPLGRAMHDGVAAHFAEVNRAGGVHGRPLELIALDDGHHPASAIRQTRALIEEHQVLALLGSIGSPTTTSVTVPVAEAGATLLLEAFTGGEERERVINYRASLDEEMERLVETIFHLGIPPDEIAFFTRHDAYGEAAYQSALRVLHRRGYGAAEQLPRGRYPPNTTHVEEALVSLIEAPREPRAIIVVGASVPAARFIHLARDLLPRVSFFTLSTIGAVALAELLPEDIHGVYVSQVTPPLDTELPLVERYHAALAAYAPNARPGFISLEGYITARILVEGIRRAGPAVERDSLITAMERLHGLDIGLGKPLHLSAEEHQASHRVWITAVEHGKVVHAPGGVIEEPHHAGEEKG